MEAEYVVGIDLGTTNCVVAYAALDDDQAAVTLLAIPQVVSPNTVEAQPSLPSFLSMATEDEAASGVFALPWPTDHHHLVGQFARQRAAEIPDRTVGAAKSWLGHHKVDRHQPILPWNAPATVPKISPVTASQRYLEHLIAAWNQAFPEAPLAKQRVVLTVPASFDASARELTREAAVAAGIPADMVLLEEPQAAVYSWLVERGDDWREELQLHDLLLVCDVGGGTTDLSLIGVEESGGELALQRRAVGNHLLVGGDNMDLTVAHYVAQRFAEQNVTLDPWQSVSLWHSCRAAKETLLGADPPGSFPISVSRRGSRLIGGTVSVEIEPAAVSDLLLDGFFPHCPLTAEVQRARASGFQELGLPFETDTAITRHVAEFLRAQADQDQPARPTRLLLNGGVFKASAVADRLTDVLGQWQAPNAPPRRLVSDDLDHAVARGAAYYGWAKHRGGVRIRGGTARSYYIGIESAGLAIPGAPRPLRALCVAPIGMEEGTTAEVPAHQIGLVVGEAAQFRFFKSSTRRNDRPGDVVPHWDPGELAEMEPVETVLTTTDSEDAPTDSPFVPVHFETAVTELGMFELWCVSEQTGDRWKLEFNAREPKD